VYDPPAPGDGVRILVDRLWPRGLTKQAAALDHWYRQIAPSTDLRTWYAHEPERFAEFNTRYRAELSAPERAAALAVLREQCSQRMVTLLTAVKALELSHATVLVRLLSEPAPPARPSTPSST
jgi:uncharacterized protein YeaO (DUF488 family)